MFSIRACVPRPELVGTNSWNHPPNSRTAVVSLGRGNSIPHMHDLDLRVQFRRRTLCRYRVYRVQTLTATVAYLVDNISSCPQISSLPHPHPQIPLPVAPNSGWLCT